MQVISEYGYGELSVARITGGAGVSRRTFYDLFEDREDCFLAVFEDAVWRARQVMVAGWRGERGWRRQTRAALLALLVFLDEEPGSRSLLIVDALKAGPRVQARRVEILGELAEVLHQTGSAAKAGGQLPALTGEGVVGAVLGVIHMRLLGKDTHTDPLVGLVNAFMGVIVLPYLGTAAAQRELARPLPTTPCPTVSQGSGGDRQGGALTGLPMRITHRTLLVLTVIGEAPGASNRQVADQAGVSDQGQASKLLTRLQGLGLIENASLGQPNGEPNRWQLTPQGQQLRQAAKRSRPATA